MGKPKPMTAEKAIGIVYMDICLELDGAIATVEIDQSAPQCKRLNDAWTMVKRLARQAAAVEARRQLPIRVPPLDCLTQGCPMQWEGHTEAGEYIYIRWRGHRLTVDLGGVGEAFNFIAMDTSQIEGELYQVRELTAGILDIEGD
jgi:hypothetical protein